tara:strand:+ start:2083 stop:2262 length:180 start_codon:yes stop_codon:yes gene_type:complete
MRAGYPDAHMANPVETGLLKSQSAFMRAGYPDPTGHGIVVYNIVSQSAFMRAGYPDKQP